MVYTICLVLIGDTLQLKTAQDECLIFPRVVPKKQRNCIYAEAAMLYLHSPAQDLH